MSSEYSLQEKSKAKIMQRVLSFPPQPNRGFGDPGEFVTKRMCLSFMFSIAFLAILAGFLLGRFVFDQELELSRTKLRKAHQHHQQVFGIYKNYSQFNVSNLVGQVSTSSLQRHLLALRNGSDSSADISQSLHEAHLLRSLLKDGSFDLISPLVQSQVNLSFPNPDRANQVLVLHGNKVVFSCNDSRPRTAEKAEHPYETDITVQGNIFYVNFGRDEDYHHLDSLGLTVKDSIALARIGRVPPLDLITNALEHETKGVILYLDPEQKEVENPFPTPADLAKLNALYVRENDKGAIPVLFIGADDAERLFQQMSTSESSSESWRGDLNSTYPIGPGFTSSDKKIVLQVNTVTAVKKYYDVMGAIRGTQEPDRFVMLVHERKPDKDGQDSTAIVMEIIRVLGILRKTKEWRPHRSIVIASWGLEGPLYSRSKDWWSQLRMKTVAYLKVESSLLGNNSTSTRGTPVLERVFQDAARTLSLKKVSLDAMLQMATDINLVENGVPFLELKQSERHAANRMKEVTSFWSFLTWKLAESHGLPYSLEAYIRFFNHSMNVIENRSKLIAQSYSLFLGSFFEAIQRLIAALSSFQTKWSHADMSKSIEMRIMNDQFLRFIRVLGCQEKSSFKYPSRHMIFSRSTRGNDRVAGFGLLQDLLRETTSTEAPDDLQQQIMTHLVGLVECINAARYALSDGLETFVLGKNETLKRELFF